MFKDALRNRIFSVLVLLTCTAISLPRRHLQPPETTEPDTASGHGADPCQHSARRVWAAIAPTTICSTTTSMSASIRRSSPSAARTPSASRCSRTARASSSTCIPLSTSTRFSSARRRSSSSATPAPSSWTFPRRSKPGRSTPSTSITPAIPLQTGRFGGFTFGKDPAGRPWIYTACEGTGASVWWPNKDQWRDEVETMDISVAIPNGLVDVSNGKFVGKTDLGDGYTRWDWHVSYPINNYDVSLNIGNYVHFADTAGRPRRSISTRCPKTSTRPRSSSRRPRACSKAYQHYFGEYPFKKDGYKLIEVPYSGMEHQSAVTYGNHFTNGYLGRDWTGVGISPRFDFIIIHESGHEWFGNSITAADRSDMWIHEGWTTYLEMPLRRIHVRARRRPQVPQRLQVRRCRTDRAHHRRARHQRHAAAGPVFQGRAVPQHTAQRGERRRALVGAAARLLPALQISKHHDRRHRRSTSTSRPA